MISTTYQNPLQYVASNTADFVQAAVNSSDLNLGKAKVLDVGCGDGLITKDLINRGFNVVAIDGNAESIEKARANGVEAIHSKLSEFEHEPFKLIYVSRALHHMPPLAETLNKLDNLLADGGLLIIEEFCRELFGQSESVWLFQKAQSIKASHSIDVENARHRWLLQSSSVEETLHNFNHHHNHKHELLSGQEMKAGLQDKFKVQSVESGPNLFRYACDFLPATTSGATEAHALYLEECDRIKSNELTAMGLRLTLTKK